MTGRCDLDLLESRPMRARGLKLSSNIAGKAAALRSRPMRARGLKLNRRPGQAVIRGSRPMRARGLKQIVARLTLGDAGRRAPCGRVD